MSGGFIVSGVATCPVDGLSVRTFAEDGVHRFASKGKRARVTELVIHETVTRSVDSTIAVLKKRGLSVHLVMGADGALTQHGDLATDIFWHASQHNGASFGVEVVNPYYPSYVKPGLPWSRVGASFLARDGGGVFGLRGLVHADHSGSLRRDKSSGSRDSSRSLNGSRGHPLPRRRTHDGTVRSGESVPARARQVLGFALREQAWVSTNIRNCPGSVDRERAQAAPHPEQRKRSLEACALGLFCLGLP